MWRLWSVVTALGLLAATAEAQPQQWGLTAAGLLHGSKGAIENQHCCGPTRNTRVNRPNNAALAKWSGLASRDGRTLMLKLAGDRTLKLTPCGDPTGGQADDTRGPRAG